MSAVNPLLSPIQQIVQGVPGLGGTTSASDLFNQAYQKLAPYYSQLLAEAQGDFDLAIKNLERDYQNGVRYAAEDTARVTKQVTDTLTGNTQQLGLAKTQADQALLDKLNQRGIALTQSPGSNKLTYAGGGQPATEVGQQNQDFQLRQEALNRNAAQQIQNQQITSTRQTEQAGISKEKGTQSAQQTLRGAGENINTEQSQQALGLSQLQFGAQQAQKQAQTQGSILGAQFGGGGGSVDPKNLTQDQRQALFQQYGHTGIAPVGYGGG
jgi:hypothetical protein